VAHGLLCWLNRTLNALRRRVNLPYLPLSILTKSRIGRAMQYIQQYEQRVALHAREARVDGHICGHIHFGAIREMDGVVYLNDGDWVEHCTGLVEHFDGRMELLHWSEHAQPLATLAGRTPLLEPVLVTAMGALGNRKDVLSAASAEAA
jgi:UDP-2,3-diacylglucosamine pyrophosphatase LpxH